MKSASILIGVCGGLFALSTITAVAVPEQGPLHANSSTLAYGTFGSPDRETVLLVSGTSMQPTAWRIQLCLQLVIRGDRLAVYDNRGIGFPTTFSAEGNPNTRSVGSRSFADAITAVASRAAGFLRMKCMRVIMLLNGEQVVRRRTR
jgi:pimeloyl-ACP methyl ester carboxylesterase